MEHNKEKGKTQRGIDKSLRLETFERTSSYHKIAQWLVVGVHSRLLGKTRRAKT